MREPSARRLAERCVKCTSYWQAVIRFGLPCVILYRGIDYLVFRVTTSGVRLRYPWGLESTLLDVILVFLLSTVWWWLTREIVAWQQKKQHG